MTIFDDGIGSTGIRQAEQPQLDTDKSFRLLFLGGTEDTLGADLAVEAFRRAFTAEDDVALVIAAGPLANSNLDIPWLQSALDLGNAPEAELIPDAVGEDELAGLFDQCQALFCAGPQATDSNLLSMAVDHGLAIILPESAMEGAGLGHAEAYPVLANPAVSLSKSIDVHPQDLAGVYRRVLAEPSAAAEKNALARSAKAKTEPVSLPTTSQTPPTPPDFNICWGASAFNYSGYAKVTRSVMASLDRHDAGWGFHSHGVDQKFVDELKQDKESYDYWLNLRNATVTDGLYLSFHPPFRVNHAQSFYRAIRRENPGFHSLAAVTMFETDRLPQGWAAECNAADEVWVPCQFNIDSFTRGGVDPSKLKKLQLGIDAAPFMARHTPFQIPGRKGFNFLSIFDWTLRKGWDVLLRAFCAAFTADDDVSMTIRAYPALKDQLPIKEQIRLFMEEEGIDPHRAPELILIEDFVSEADMPALYQAADCFVLPSRGEGWGLPYMEAMASGLPTIGTRWSGQLEFMHDANSYLIDLEGLVPVFPEQTRLSAFYEEDHLWAQPSACHLKELMRHVVENQAEAAAIGKQAQHEVATKWTTDRMMARLYELSEDLVRRKKIEAARPDPQATPSNGIIPSVAWAGPIYDASGYADEGRNFVTALSAQGSKVLTFPMNWTTRLAELPKDEDAKLRALESTPLPADLPAVMVQHTLGEILEPSQAGYPCAGRTMFETDSLPPNWVTRCNTLERIWVPSEFNRRTFINAGVDPHRLRVLHCAFDVEAYRDINNPIDFGSGKSKNLLSVFDWTQRKGWDLLIEAWAREFSPDDDICLVLKVWSSLGKSMQQIYDEISDHLINKVGKRPEECAEILLYDHHIPEPDMPRLYAGADAFVLPTRGEGWGRPIMEAMAAGVPVLATNWGGNTEFMNMWNSLPIDYKLVPCSDAAVREARWFQDHKWAECDVGHLQFLMRRVYEDEPLIPAIAARGRKDVFERFNRDVIGARLADLVIDLSECRQG